MAKFTAEVDTARGEHRLLLFRNEMRSDFNAMLDDVAKDSWYLFVRAAPKRSRTLKTGIKLISQQRRITTPGTNFSTFGSGRVYAITAQAKNKATGYDYVGVTRFGHRAAVIKPKHTRRAASVISTTRKRLTPKTGKAALVLPVGGSFKTRFRFEVPAYHPSVDWAAAPTAASKSIARNKLARLGKKLDAKGKS